MRRFRIPNCGIHSLPSRFFPEPFIRLGAARRATTRPSAMAPGVRRWKSQIVGFSWPSATTPHPTGGEGKFLPCHAPFPVWPLSSFDKLILRQAQDEELGKRGARPCLPISLVVARTSRPARLLAPLSRLGVAAVSRRKARAWGLITQRGEPTSRQPGTGASPRCPVRTGVPWKIARGMIREGLGGVEKRRGLSTRIADRW